MSLPFHDYLNRLAYRLAGHIARNHKAKQLSRLAFACNDQSILSTSKGEWFLASPYGEFPIKQVIKGKVVEYIQHFHRAQADKMVTNFNALKAQTEAKIRKLNPDAEDCFPGLPVFKGHPDADPDSYPDGDPRGRFKAIEARDTGLWVKPNWNALGNQNLTEKLYIYPSPAWRYQLPDKGSNVIYPDELVSIGLTNDPNIGASIPITNANPGDDPEEEETETDTATNDMKKLHALLGVPETAGEDGLTSAIQKIQSDCADHAAANSKLKAGFASVRKACNDAGITDDMITNAAKEIDATLLVPVLSKRFADAALLPGVTTKLETLTNAAVGNVLDSAITRGVITNAERPQHETALKTDFATNAKLLLEKKPALNTKSIELNGNRHDISTADSRRTIVNQAVAEYQAKYPNADYNTAHNAVKKDPRFAAVFEAMQQPAGKK